MSVKTRIAISVASGVAAACALAYLFAGDSQVVDSPSEIRSAFQPGPKSAIAIEGNKGGEAPVPPAENSSVQTAGNREDDESQATFRLDDTGSLIVDEQTRLRMEALLGSTEPNNVYAATREQTKNLPPAAAKRAEELLDRFDHYQQAQRHTYPPGVAPVTEEDAIAQLDGLHALREAHFGADVAAAFYGNEEKLSRELIDLMRLEKDPGLTLQEKAERAQVLHDRLPTIAAIEKKNRESQPGIADGQENRIDRTDGSGVAR